MARRGIEKRFPFFGLGPTLTVAISFDRFMARAANRRKLRVVIPFQHRLAVAEMMHFCRAISARLSYDSHSLVSLIHMSQSINSPRRELASRAAFVND